VLRKKDLGSALAGQLSLEGLPGVGLVDGIRELLSDACQAS
jgi:hypothetical protein